MPKLPYFALALVAALLANIAASLAIPSYRDALRSARGMIWTGSLVPPVAISPAPAASTGTGTGEIFGSEVVSGVQTIRVERDPTPTPVTAEPETPATGPEVVMPEALVLRLIPKIVLEKTDKSRIFGREFPGLRYATYADTRYELGAHAIDLDLLSFRKLFAGEEDKLKDTDAFFGKTVFYNGIEDSRVRFFFPFGGKTVAMDLPSVHYYSLLKPLLLP